MLLETMSFKEMAHHVKSEYSTCRERMHTSLLTNYRRAIVKLPNANPHFFPLKSFKTKNNVTFYMIPIAQTGKKSLRNGLFGIFFTSMHRHDGTYYFLIEHNFNQKVCISIMSPHFLSRYIERMNLDMEPMDAVVRFLTTNLGGTSDINMSSYKHRNDDEYAEANKEGIVFGTRLEDIHIMNTFVSNDMLFKSQNDRRVTANEGFAQMIENFFNEKKGITKMINQFS